MLKKITKTQIFFLIFMINMFFVLIQTNLIFATENINQTKANDVNIQETKNINSNSLMESSGDVKSKINIKQNKLSIIDMFIQSSLIVKLVMFLLLLISVWSWAIIIDKILTLRMISRKVKIFEDNFWTGRPFEEIMNQIQKRAENHPLSNIFVSMFQELKDSILNKNLKSNYQELEGRLNRVSQIEINKAMSIMEINLPFLATVGSISVFIGLFGTVCGIMQNFQAIAISQNTSLAVVAPGIAEALLATALGLVAALPALLFYNKFLKDIEFIALKIDNFRLELSNLMLKEIS